MLIRNPRNPVISPSQVRPSQSGYTVVGAFNAGATTYAGQTILLVRVAERPESDDPRWVLCPHVDLDGRLTTQAVRRDDPDYDLRDSRFVRHLATGAIHLTSLSHLRLARSADGLSFKVDEHPWLQPMGDIESFGVEDARITRIDETYYVNYSAVSPHGIATSLACTTDFSNLERLGVIFPPSNRDVTLFPELIDGQYVCYHRPMPGEFGRYSIWCARSSDLKHWGRHRPVLEGSETGWDSGRVGGGAPPIRTSEGWLSIYHAADRNQRYCLGAFLADHRDPARVIARLQTPILSPEAPYEVDGFFRNVVFTCGVTVDGDDLRIYYGASDETIALAEGSVSEIVSALLQQ